MVNSVYFSFLLIFYALVKVNALKILKNNFQNASSFFVVEILPCEYCQNGLK